MHSFTRSEKVAQSTEASGSRKSNRLHSVFTRGKHSDNTNNIGMIPSTRRTMASENRITFGQHANIPVTPSRLLSKTVAVDFHKKQSTLDSDLKIGAVSDAEEKQADRVAAHIMRAPASNDAMSVNSTAPQKIRMSSTHVANSAQSAPRSVVETLGMPGEALDANTRAFFESRFHQDFSTVRIHRDSAAAESARNIAARAYTFGPHIAFAQGHYAPHTRKGRGLLAHELAHVVQQDASIESAKVVRRSSDEASKEVEVAAESSEEMSDQEAFAVEITTDPNYDDHKSFMIILTPSDFVDLGVVYPGDLLVIRRFDANMDALSDEVDLALPPGLELVEITDSGGIQLRVSSNAVTGSTVSIGLQDAAGHEHQLNVSIEALPAGPEAVNPEFDRLHQAQASLSERRRASRQRARNERRLARAQRRASRKRLRQEARSDESTPASARAARRTNRHRFRNQRRARRFARREERREERAEAKGLRAESRAFKESVSCSEETQNNIQAALQTAIAATDRTLTRLSVSNALSEPAVSNAMTNYMRWSPGNIASSETTRHLARIMDTLTVARNSMTIASHGDFQCVDDCKETTGAYVRDGSRKRDQTDSGVSVCSLWRIGRGLIFPVARDVDSARAYALLHEFVHKSGPFASEQGIYYVGRDAWNTLNAKDALNYADGYASMAWVLANEKE